MFCFSNPLYRSRTYTEQPPSVRSSSPKAKTSESASPVATTSAYSSHRCRRVVRPPRRAWRWETRYYRLVLLVAFVLLMWQINKGTWKPLDKSFLEKSSNFLCVTHKRNLLWCGLVSSIGFLLHVKHVLKVDSVHHLDCLLYCTLLLLSTVLVSTAGFIALLFDEASKAG